MKVGDYVGWSFHKEEIDSPQDLPAGIIVEACQESISGESHAVFLILLQHNGELSWEFGSDLEVINESR